MTTRESKSSGRRILAAAFAEVLRGHPVLAPTANRSARSAATLEGACLPLHP
ncbi:hypothetical protein AB5J72_09895 [Streptomyces sp. CG1]|uniref:hypothetical protein n=1 Tax=Streptomyces sp. CG1 TaxID=1287523 RepID=UPI0034E244C3